MPRKERRRAPRLQVLDQIEGRLVSLPLQVTLRDMGPLGFSVESALPFSPGASRLFLFTTAGGIQIMIEGAAVYSRPDDDGDARYITGFSVLMDAISGLTESPDDPLGDQSELGV
jgi:hypothetical protein